MVVGQATHLRCPKCGKRYKIPGIFPLYCTCGNVIQQDTYEQCSVDNRIEKFIAKLESKPWGVGTELKFMLAELGFSMKTACNCGDTAAYMDQIGPERCRIEIAFLAGQIAENAKQWSWSEKLLALGGSILRPKAVAIYSAIDLTRPYESLILEAIRRVEGQ